MENVIDEDVTMSNVDLVHGVTQDPCYDLYLDHEFSDNKNFWFYLIIGNIFIFFRVVTTYNVNCMLRNIKMINDSQDNTNCPVHAIIFTS